MIKRRCLVLLLIILGSTAEVKSSGSPTPIAREYKDHGSLWTEFDTLYRAAEDLGGGEGTVKVNGIPPTILDAISQRVGSHVPSTRIHRAGCVAAANQLVGPSSRGTYDLLLPQHSDGVCKAPSLMSQDANFTMTMHWRNESPDHQQKQYSLPPVGEVYDAIFARKDGKIRLPEPNGPSISFWMLSFVNWFHDDNFRTLPNTDGGYTWSDSGGLHLAQLYGHTLHRQRALRTLSYGKMKTSSRLGWDFYPPLLSDIQRDFPEFEMWSPTSGSTFNSTAANKTQTDQQRYFAMGDPRFNMHPGHIMWHSIALYLHNSACDVLVSQASFFSDEDIFQRARVIVFHIIQKIRLQDFVSDAIAHTRDLVRVQYDPPSLREHLAPHFPFAGGSRPNFLEFNHVYQAWHALIPDNLQLKRTAVPLRDTMWAPDMFDNYSIAELASSFADTPLAKYTPHNFPFFVRGVTEDAIRNERAQRLPTYNAYRKYLGMKPLTSFHELAVDNPDEVGELYNHNIDQLEFLPGVMADSNSDLPGNFMGDVQLLLVAMFALHDVANSAMIQNPLLWHTNYLTEAGLQFVKDFEFRDLLSEITGQAYPCSFRTTDSKCFEPDEWKEPHDVGACFLKPSRMCSYVGVDLTEWFFYENGYMRMYYIAMFMSMAIVMLLYVTVFALFSHVWPLEGQCGSIDGSKSGANRDSERDTAREQHNNQVFLLRLRLSSLTVSCLLCTLLVVPSSIFWYQLVSDPFWFQKFAYGLYRVSVWTTALVASHFLADVAFRLGQWRYTTKRASQCMLVQLLVHHLAFFALAANLLVSADLAAFKIAMTLLTFWFWEWPLFGAFVVLRIWDAIELKELWNRHQDGCDPYSKHKQPGYRNFVTRVLPVLVVIYFATRLLETTYIIMMMICLVQRGLASAAVWVQILVAIVAISLQYQAGYVLVSFYLRRKAALLTSAMVVGLEEMTVMADFRRRNTSRTKLVGREEMIDCRLRDTSRVSRSESMEETVEIFPAQHRTWDEFSC